MTHLTFFFTSLLDALFHEALCFYFFRKLINIKIFDDEEYEKNEEFYLVLDEPCLLRKGSGTYIFIYKYVFLSGKIYTQNSLF